MILLFASCVINALLEMCLGGLCCDAMISLKNTQK